MYQLQTEAEFLYDILQKAKAEREMLLQKINNMKKMMMEQDKKIEEVHTNTV
jgi:hypothetical protein